MYKLNLKEGKFPIIIKPNLGQPILLNLRDFRDDNDKTGPITRKVVFNAIILVIPGQSIQEILEYFHLNIYIQPILKDEGNFSERRGKRYPLQILEINRLNLIEDWDNTILTDENCFCLDTFQTALKIDNLFGERKNLFKIKIKIKELKVITTLLKESERDFLLFDIVHDVPNKIEDKINYHSIALFDKDWSDFNFIHATDFHVARRNDFIIKFMKNKVKSKINLYKNNEKKLSNIDSFILKRDFEFKEEFQEHRHEDLRRAKYNFNYNLRKLVEFINQKVIANQLDFVLMTGDLVDYIDIARGNYQYKNNFKVFIDILLGLNRGLDKPPHLIEDEYVNKKEIMAPVFTIVGNHDYRKGHYSLRAGSVHNIFGLTKKDIKGYHDIKFFNYFKAIYSRDKFLRDYFRYINPSLNYRFNIGNHCNFIFLDTGQDSIADMYDLLKGGPSTKGLKDYQIKLLRTYIQLSGDQKIIIVMHTPPISPSLGSLKRRKFKRKFKLKRDLQWSDFYEYNLKRTFGNPRLDKALNLKYQTIMYNWATFLKIMTGSDKIIRRKVDLILCGHTHTLKEFRLKETQDPININLGFYIAPIYINVPCEVYTNRYRDIFKSFKDQQDLKIWFDVNKPFIFQTQALGPISTKYKFKPPGFRYIMSKDGQIKRINVYSLHLKETLTETDKKV